MDPPDRIEIVRELCSFAGRRAGTDAERRAAKRMAERLRELGRRAEVEPTYVHPQSNLAHAVHCLLGFAGSLVSIALAPLGFALVLIAATSLYLDLNYRAYLVRSLFFRRASQNVLARGRHPERRHRVILCAHLDAGRTGVARSPRAARLAARFGGLLGVPVGPFRLLFWSLAALLPLLGARMAGLEPDLVSLLQLPPTLILLVGAFMLAESELASVSPGANDDASGVATVLALAGELEREPLASLDVWVLLTGGEQCQQEGMRSFVRAHRHELQSAATTFICLDTVGRGELRYEASAGWVVSYGMDRRLVELCKTIGELERERGDAAPARPLRNGAALDSLPPRIRGLRSIGITCRSADGSAPGAGQPSDLPDAVASATLERAARFTLELVRALDRDATRAGQRLAEQPGEPQLAPTATGRESVSTR